jgi:hypothetical protein
MESEETTQILNEVDRILAAVGQTNYESLRGTMQTGSVLLSNLGRLCGEAAAKSHEDLISLANGMPKPEQEQTLRLLVGLRASLPTIGRLLRKAAEFFPPNPGGKPKIFGDRETIRHVCEMVAARIYKGDSEGEAQVFAAKKFDVGYQTIHRVWGKRIELKEESFEELFTSFLASLSITSDGVTPIVGLGNLMKSPRRAAPPSIDPEGTKQHELIPSDGKIGDK